MSHLVVGSVWQTVRSVINSPGYSVSRSRPDKRLHNIKLKLFKVMSETLVVKYLCDRGTSTRFSEYNKITKIIIFLKDPAGPPNQISINFKTLLEVFRLR